MRHLNKEVWPFSTEVSIDYGNRKYSLIDEWCETTIGKRFKDWYGYNSDNSLREYAFKDEATLLVFKIKWGWK